MFLSFVVLFSLGISSARNEAFDLDAGMMFYSEKVVRIIFKSKHLTILSDHKATKNLGYLCELKRCSGCRRLR